jgi:nicotinamidase-related amidase
MARAVIVMDMLRGFLEEGCALYCGAEAREIIPNVQRLLEDMKAEGAGIIYLADAHEPDDKEFQMFPPHCIKGTVEAEVIPELSDYPGLVIPKQSYSSFYGTNLDDVLAEIQPDEVFVVGVCTDICIMYSVADLRNRGYPVKIYADCVASFDQSAHDFALKHIERVLGGQVIDKYRSR